MIRAAVAGLAVLAVVSVGPAAAAPERDALVRPGRGIGKVALGMTPARVRAVLGGTGIVAKRRTIGFGRMYIELQWAYGAWNVGFEGRPGAPRAVMVGTTLRGQRTREGLGLGSRTRDILRVHPRATCSDWPGLGSESSIDRWLVVRHPNGSAVVFALMSTPDAPPVVHRVVEVMVRRPARGLAEKRVACPANWRRQ